MSEFSIVPRSLSELQQMAEMYAKGAIGVPLRLVGRPAEIAMLIQAGMELGMRPMAALRSFWLPENPGEAVIPRLYADAMVGVACSHSEICTYVRCVEETQERCTWETLRRGHPAPQRSSWSMEQQRAIGWGPESEWGRYPIRMMHARAKANLMRDVYPDILGGMYAVEEMEAAPRPPPPPAVAEIAAAVTQATAPIAAEPAQEAASEDGFLAAVAAAPTVQELDAIISAESVAVVERHAIDVMLRRIALADSEAALKRLSSAIRRCTDLRAACRKAVDVRLAEFRGGKAPKGGK